MQRIFFLFLFFLFPCILFAGDIEIIISGADAPVNGSVYTATGGEAPYTWDISCGSISVDGVVTSASNCCGKGIVSVKDACGYKAEKIVRMPNGLWVQTFFCIADGFLTGCGHMSTEYKATYDNFRYFHRSSCLTVSFSCEASYQAAGGIVLGQRSDCVYYPEWGCLGVGIMEVAVIYEWRCQ